MNLIFDKIFEYGYHDTDLTRIDNEGMFLKLFFENGLYTLDDKGTELSLTEPIMLCLKINSIYKNVDNIIEISINHKKDRYIEYEYFKKILKKDGCGITNLYFSDFNDTILIDGMLENKRIIITIEGVEEVLFSFIKQA